LIVPTVVTLRPHPLSLESTLPHFLEELNLNVSAFATVLHALQELEQLLHELLLHEPLLHAAAPVIDMTKKTNVKIQSVFIIVFIIYILRSFFQTNVCKFQFTILFFLKVYQFGYLFI
jgi:hypothetical protein